MGKIMLSTKVSPKLTTMIWVHNVPFTMLEKNRESYSLTYQDKRYKLRICLVGAFFNFIESSKSNETKKKSRNLAPFSVSRNDDQTIDLGVQINNISGASEYDFTQGPLLIEHENEEEGSFTIEIKDKPLDLLEKIKQAQKKVKEKEKRKNKKLKKEKEKKERINELLKKFDEYEAKYRDSPIQQEKDLKSKGIYLAYPDAYKRCENCANNTGSKCSVHNVEVSDNHRCSRFYSYKTVYGGGFSPK